MILADEPTGALDSHNAKNTMSILEKINNELKSTILMVTHDPMSASYCKKVVFLKDGKIIKILEREDMNRKQFYKAIVDINLQVQQEWN